MYLLVFVTLVIALTGVYAEALSLQAARFNAQQTTVAEAMQNWQSTAIALARFAVTTAPGAGGCDLTVPGFVGVPCSNGLNTISVSTGNPPAPLVACPYPPTAGCWSSLPNGYKTAPYTFYSVYYQPAAGQNYVITFVPPPDTTKLSNPPPGFITLPGTGAGALAQIGVTMSDLFRQIQNTGMQSYAFGTVIAGNPSNLLQSPPLTDGLVTSQVQYNLPAGVVIPAGSVAVIAPL